MEPTLKGADGKLEVDKSKYDTAKWVRECVADLVRLAEKGESTLVVAGYRQPKEVHLAAMGINAILQNIGETVVLQAHEQSFAREPVVLLSHQCSAGSH